MDKKDTLKREMLEKINSGGAWFTTRENKYVKISYIAADGCLYARECFIGDGTLEGGAYTFGQDWFDISFHGRYIDIYANAETFRSWDVWYDPDKGTCYKAAEEDMDRAKKVFKFCKQADMEALAGGLNAYRIDGTNFAAIIEMSK